MNRVWLVILGVLVLGSAGFGLAQLDETRKLKQSLAALDQERAALQKRIWDLQKRNNELANRRPGVAAAAGEDGEVVAESPAGPEAGPGGPGGRRGGRPDGGRGFAAVMSSPEVQKLMGIQQKAALDGRYAALFKQMQLSPAELEKFKNLLVEKQSAVMDVMAAARSEGLSGRDNRDQIRQLVQDAQGEVENNIKSTLGDAAYAQYQNYEATVPERNTVSQLGQRLSYSSTPLTDDQSSQLVQILAQNAPAGGGEGRGGGGAAFGQLLAGAARAGGATIVAGGSTPITDAAIAQAQGVLSAQQLSALQGLQQEQQASAQLRQQLRGSFGNGTRTSTGTAATTSTTPPPKPAGPGGK